MNERWIIIIIHAVAECAPEILETVSEFACFEVTESYLFKHCFKIL